MKNSLNNTTGELNTKPLEEKIAELPKLPGVYLFFDKNKKIIYIGKSRSLKDRVSSYFIKNLEIGSKTESLVSKITDLDFIEVNSELEALLLESELIKRYKPKYNISLKDDKSYKYIFIRDERVLDGNYPVVGTTRLKESTSKKGVSYFGPFPEGKTVFDVVMTLRRLIPFRDCSLTKFTRHNKLGKPCLYGHIGLCSGPCVRLATQKEYTKNISLLKRFLKGESSQILDMYRKNMLDASRKEDYEKAAYYRDLLKKFEYISQQFTSASKFVSNPNLLEDMRSEALESLRTAIPSLTKAPMTVECFDIANISGTFATASLITAVDGNLYRGGYKRFRIKTKSTPDDFEMLREVLRRRLSPKNIERWGVPDLLVLDGGVPQVSAGTEVLAELKLQQIPLVGLAKKEEIIVIKGINGYSEVKLSRDNEGLRLLMRMRDEAHRFSRRYHHLLRSKNLLSEIKN